MFERWKSLDALYNTFFMEKYSNQPEDAAYSNARPLDTEALDTGAPVQAAEINAAEASIANHATALLELASRAAGRDELARNAYVHANRYAMLSIVPSSIWGLTAGFIGIDPTLARLGPLGTVGVGAAWVQMYVSAAKTTTLHLPDGYALQCLQVDRSSDIPLIDSDKRVAVAVHPRTYEGHAEPVALTKRRLAAALDVLAATAYGEKSDIGSIILPVGVLRRAGLNVEGVRNYKAIIDELTTTPAVSPYGERERAVVMSIDRAKEYADLIREDKEPLMARVFAELAERYPSKRLGLQADNQAIVPLLHSLLERASANSGGMVTKEKAIIRVPRDEGYVDVWDGAWRCTIDDTSVSLNRSNPYNPRIIQRNGRTGQELSNTDLRSMTGGDQAMQELPKQLQRGSCDTTLLIRAALEMVEAARSTDDSLSEPPEQNQSDPADLGAAASVLVFDKERLNSGKYMSTFLGRILVGAALMGGFAGFSDALIEGPRLVEAQPVYNAPITPMFRVEDHGLPQQSPYWAVATSYVYKDGRWSSVQQNNGLLQVPRALDNQEQPHLTVQTRTNKENVELPVEEGTRIAAIRAFDVNGEPVPIAAYQNDDGTVFTNTTPMKRAAYRIEYDLVSDPKSRVHAVAPMRVDDGDTISHPSYYPQASDGVEAAAEYVRTHLIYDDSQQIKDTLSRQPNSGAYVSRVYDEGRCQCEQCNTAVGFVASRIDPGQELALVSGYLHQDDPHFGHSYLVEGHAWLNDGHTVDATAETTDSKSAIPQYDDTSYLDGSWGKQGTELRLTERKPIRRWPKEALLWPLAGVALAGAAGVELRHRVLRNAAGFAIGVGRRVVARMGIDRDDAVRLIGWQAYAPFASRVPDIHRPAGVLPLDEANLPTEALHDVKRGGFVAGGHLSPRELRGLRFTAASILYDRRRAEARGGRR